MNDKTVVSEVKEIAKDLLAKMEIKAEVEVHLQTGDEGATSDDESKQYVMVKILGEDLGILVGHHGKVLESMQTILGLILSKKDDNKYRVVLNINDYRERRAEYLESMALQAVEQVKQSGQDMELEPMKPSERRIVHMTLQGEEGIETESVGEGDARRIIIKASKNK